MPTRGGDLDGATPMAIVPLSKIHFGFVVRSDVQRTMSSHADPLRNGIQLVYFFRMINRVLHGPGQIWQEKQTPPLQLQLV